MAINGICSGCEFFFPLPLFSAVILQLFGVMQRCCILVTCKSEQALSIWQTQSKNLAFYVQVKLFANGL
jgi:hypothetical protein